MSSSEASPRLLRPGRPSRVAGVAAALVSVAIATALIYPLKRVSPVLSLGVLYVLAVVIVATFWGLVFGVCTSVLSAAAFNFFHLPPRGRFDLADEREWVALLVFVIVAITSGLVAELARARSQEAQQRRQEADLAAEMAQQLLGGASLRDALEHTARSLARAVGVADAAIVLADEPQQQSSLGFALNANGRRIGTLAVPATLTVSEHARIAQRVVPALQSLLAAALHRSELQSEVVETAALRRSDELKTAVLRSVSHDLRTPLTAILMAATALDAEHPTRENVADVREQVLEAGTRLWRLIEKLLDLSVLQAGRAEPRTVWYSLEEVLQEAIERVGAPSGAFKPSIDRELPLLQGDPGQLESAFANVLENAVRYSGEKAVAVRARVVGERIRVLISDQGPGIPRSERERIFLPFYRVAGRGQRDSGSGLGLAIARGFLELNGGRIALESTPGQGTTFVIEFPLPAHQALAVAGNGEQPLAGGLRASVG